MIPCINLKFYANGMSSRINPNKSWSILYESMIVKIEFTTPSIYFLSSKFLTSSLFKT